MDKFTQEEIDWLRDNNITHAKQLDDGTPIGVADFMTTWGLVTGYEPTDSGRANYHRFCFPKSTFSLDEVIEFAEEWDGISMPPRGWLKYKGVLGEFRPEDGEFLS